jgi:hypothetical protein
LILLVGSEAATLAQVPFISTWNTPIGPASSSLPTELRSVPAATPDPDRFANSRSSRWCRFRCGSCLSSHNLYLENWHYVGLPETRWRGCSAWLGLRRFRHLRRC